MADINQSYKFSSPYPQPRYDYPTAHMRTPSASDIRLDRSDGKSVERVSSPTPSERIEMNEPFWPKRIPSWETLKQPKTILYISIAVLLTAFTVAITIYHKQIEDWLHPAATWVQKLKFGWLIPIAILFVISFPPLFGHEIVAVLCGNVWGLWIGFGIVSAGTLLGEIGNFYAFRYICQARGDKLEHESWIYACLARCVRRGGFKIAVMARLSAIPGHFTTAIFATCGMNIIVFIFAAILSMPKQFITVYLGVLLEQSADPNKKPDAQSRAISISVSVITGLLTLGAGWYIYIKMRAERLGVVRERRERLGYKSSYANGGVVQVGFGGGKFSNEGRQPLTRAVNDSSASLVSNDVFNPRSSESDVHQPLNGYSHDRASGNFELQVPKPQRWDAYGRAIPDEFSSGSGGSQPYGLAVPLDGRGSGVGGGHYDDPYAYNAYPPQPQQQFRSNSQTRDVLSPFQPGGSGPPPTVAPVTRAGYESRPIQMGSPTDVLPSPQRSSARSPPPPSFHSQDPRRGNTNVEQPESPFEDKHAVGYIPPIDPPPRSNPISAHLPRFQLSDGPAAASRHEAEPTDASFYSAHSKLDSEES